MAKLTSKLSVSSPAFKTGGAIPRKFTADGQDVSPALEWDDLPAGTKSIAVIADDPDAPGGSWTHWVMFNLPPTLKGLEEGYQGAGVAGNNGFRRGGYGGPCPPRGAAHRYFFKVFALDTLLDLPAGATQSQLEAAMKGHILAQGETTGRYQR